MELLSDRKWQKRQQIVVAVGLMSPSQCNRDWSHCEGQDANLQVFRFLGKPQSPFEAALRDSAPDGAPGDQIDS